MSRGFDPRIDLYSLEDNQTLYKLYSDEEQIDIIKTSNNTNLKLYLTESQFLNEEAQLLIAHEGKRTLIRSLAYNQILFESIQELLIRSQDIMTSQFVASNESITYEIQKYIINKMGNLHLEIAEYLGDNPAIEPDIQQKLFDTGDSTILMCLSQNPSLIEPLQIKLMDKHIGYIIRYNKKPCEKVRNYYNMLNVLDK